MSGYLGDSMNEQRDNEAIKGIVTAMRGAESLLFITGAGVSAESGIPTYRGIGGLYNVDTTEEGYAIEEALSASMLAENPLLTWKYLAQIGLAVHGRKHNRAHEIIAEMESAFDRVWTLTQNVDGFHRSAGSKNLIEAHGNMHSLSCTRCDYHVMLEEYSGLEIPPKCPECSSLIRPDVVLFGELIDGPGVEHLQAEIEKGFDIVFSVGTTSVFPYIQAPVMMAKAAGKITVEINPCDTEVSDIVDYQIKLPAREALERIWGNYRSEC